MKYFHHTLVTPFLTLSLALHTLGTVPLLPLCLSSAAALCLRIPNGFRLDTEWCACLYARCRPLLQTTLRLLQTDVRSEASRCGGMPTCHRVANKHTHGQKTHTPSFPVHTTSSGMYCSPALEVRMNVASAQGTCGRHGGTISHGNMVNPPPPGKTTPGVLSIWNFRGAQRGWF